LREIVEADGTRYAVLDFIVEVPVERASPFEEIQSVLGFDWGVRVLVTASVVDLDGHQIGRPFFLDTGPFDGRQARLRRQIDQLKTKVARLEQQRDRFPVDDPRRRPSEEALPILRREIGRCWRKYAARNNDLAHLAANILLVLASTFDCKLIAGESLKSMKSAGRGKGAKGRWRNWRNTSQVRGELWRVLRYTCFLAGVRLEWQQPRQTSHVCPRCGSPADTYSAPSHRDQITAWGAWLCCSNPACLWNGSRDYAASVNIARLGAALIRHVETTGRVKHPVITDPSVQPVSYIGTRAALRLPPLAPPGHLMHSGRIYCNGWCFSVRLRSSYATPIMLRLCG
jgi:transposase